MLTLRGDSCNTTAVDQTIISQKYPLAQRNLILYSDSEDNEHLPDRL